MEYEMPVTGTDVWYYFICKRQSWLMLHRIAPDEEDENIEIGRFLHEYYYGRAEKEITIDSIKIDQIKRNKDELIVQEVKKSSKYKESAYFQLLYYLDTLNKMGIKAKGELVFPEERKKEKVELTSENKQKLEKAIIGIRELARLPIPPPPKKIKFCRKCAYREYCWPEG